MADAPANLRLGVTETCPERTQFGLQTFHVQAYLRTEIGNRVLKLLIRSFAIHLEMKERLETLFYLSETANDDGVDVGDK